MDQELWDQELLVQEQLVALQVSGVHKLQLLQIPQWAWDSNLESMEFSDFLLRRKMVLLQLRVPQETHFQEIPFLQFLETHFPETQFLAQFLAQFQEIFLAHFQEIFPAQFQVVFLEILLQILFLG